MSIQATPTRRAPAATRTRTPGPPPAKPLLALVLFPIIAVCVVWTFAWPTARTAPHDLPIGVVGSATDTAAVRQRLAATGDAFAARAFPDENAARKAIGDREIYGAVVAGSGGTTVLTAPAASPAVARLLTQVFAPAAGQTATRSVVPLPRNDPNGAALPSLIVPLVLSGIVGGVLGLLMVRRLRQRLLVLVAGSAAAGLLCAALVQGWLELLNGSQPANAGTLALTVLSIASPLAGLSSLIGPRGIGMAAVVFAVAGNAFSGVASAPDLLPVPVGAIGALLPPGAGVGLLRSTAYFDGAGALGHLAVLVGWSLLGLVLLCVSAAKSRPAPVAQD
ncbi:hypothetical protein [Microbispora sp. NPDC049125]|uniref:hypothetical protein n=1 Tax=Microbispora sp. NPDC049125 TaxID=3154929 RepID=UPI00346787EC